MIPGIELLPPGAVWFAGLLVKVTVVLLVAVTLALLLRRTSAAVRHMVWTAAILSVLALPVLAAVLPWRLPVITVAAPSPVVPVAPEATITGDEIPDTRAPRDVGPAEWSDGAGTGAERTPSDWSVTSVLITLWLAGAGLLLLRLVVGAVFLARVAREGEPLTSPDWTRPLLEAADRLGLDRAPRLLMSARLPMPYASGLFRPSIVLPESAAEWDDRRRRAVLCHELAHLRRLDLVLNALGQIACALWWFHPLVWTAARRLRTESERACDDLVLGVGTRASEYADHLLHIVCGALRARTPAVALPMAQRHEFEGRMLAILDRDAPRGRPTRRHAVALAALAGLVVLPVAALGVARVEVSAQRDPSVSASMTATGIPSASERPISPPPPAEAGEPAEPDKDVDPEIASEENAEWVARAEQDTGTPRVVAALLKALGDPVADVRRDAAYALGNLEAPAGVGGLARLLVDDADAGVREMAAWALGQIESRGGTASLADAVRRDSSTDVRAMAVWALGQLEDPQSVTTLAAALGDRSDEVRSRAAWALGTIGARPAPAALMDALSDRVPAVRVSAAWALGQIEDTAAVRPLVAALDDSDAEVRRAAFWAAAQLGEGAQPALLAALEHKDPEIRAMAARALGGGGVDPWPRPWPMPLHR
jgi:HEAT repeat protein/beta-lactamase regulating signal transducer with metallopeptidase domain